MSTSEEISRRYPKDVERLGFHVEALLPDWVEDREGHTRDLLLMAYALHARERKHS